MVNLAILANMLARQAGMQVVWDPSAPTFAIGKSEGGKMVVIIPPALASVQAADVVPMTAMLRGAMAHEALGHGRHTDFSVRGSTAYAQSLANALEDIRIEALAPKALPGARKILAEMVAALEERGFWDPTDNPNCNIGIGIMRLLRTEILAQPLDAAKNAAFVKEMRELLGDAVFAQVMAIGRRGATGATTKDAVDAAEDICKLLKQDQSNQQSQQNQQTAPQSNQAQQSQQQGTNGNPQPGNGRDQAGAQGDQGQTAQGNQAGQGGDASGDGQGGTSRPSGNPGNGQGRGERGFQYDPNATFNASPEDAIKDWVATNQDSCRVKPAQDWRKSRSALHKHSRPINAMAHKLRTRMRDLLQAQADDEDEAAGETGRLQSSSLVPARAGRRDVFFEDGDIAPGLDTAIEIMVDASGSMSGIAAHVTECLVAVGDACAEFHGLVDISMSFFNEGRAVVLKPEETWKAHRSQLAQLYQANGGTRWPGSAMTAVADVSTSRRNRKIVLTITDGDFGDPTDVIETAKMARVELANVVIGSNIKPAGMVVENVLEWSPDAFVKATVKAIQRAMHV